MSRPAFARLVLPVVLAAAALVGCGSDADPLALVQGAAAETTGQGTARMVLTSEAPAPSGEPITAEGEGLLDFEAERARISISLGEGGAALPGLGEIETIADGETIYLRIGEQGDALGVDTAWISIDLARAAEEAAGVDVSELTQSQARSDPTQGLALLQGVADEVTEVGEEEVRGEPTTHYRATVDLGRAYEEAEAVTDPEQFQAFIDQFGAEEIEVEVWIDEEGRARRTRYEQPALDGAEPGTFTVELYDFGTDETVELPSAEEVTDLTDQLLAETGGDPVVTGEEPVEVPEAPSGG